MAPPKNTYTVTLADTHAHTAQFAGVAASSHADAVLNVLQAAPSNWAQILDTDTLTITTTQP